MVMQEKMRGVTSLRIGSTPRARMASICSVTTIEPSSLAMEEALRPETMMPVRTGPSSRIMVRLTKRPVTAVAPNCGQSGGRLQGEHAAGEKAGEQHDGGGSDADDVGLHEEIGPVDRRAKEVRKRAIREQGIIPVRSARYSLRFSRSSPLPCSCRTASCRIERAALFDRIAHRGRCSGMDVPAME